MVEVFKTNVQDEDHALLLVAEIQKSFPGYIVNFDLEDCDRILRVKSSARIDADSIIKLLHELGYHAGILPDEVPTFAL